MVLVRSFGEYVVVWFEIWDVKMWIWDEYWCLFVGFIDFLVKKVFIDIILEMVDRWYVGFLVMGCRM